MSLFLTLSLSLSLSFLSTPTLILSTFILEHCVNSGKSKMRAVGVVEAGYGHEQKVGGT
ncbi:unnamed protein product, partial [Vitis vinifera]|uniref:Uncharacterized protein n=1 Tax=Vitis vinifera TaxID=29760 RepID=D7T0N6_VITVI